MTQRKQRDLFTVQAILVWLACGYSRSEVAAAFGLTKTQVNSLVRDHKTAHAELERTASWSGLPMTAAQLDIAAAQCWSAVGYKPGEIADGMRVPVSRVLAMLEGRALATRLSDRVVVSRTTGPLHGAGPAVPQHPGHGA